MRLLCLHGGGTNNRVSLIWVVTSFCSRTIFPVFQLKANLDLRVADRSPALRTRLEIQLWIRGRLSRSSKSKRGWFISCRRWWLFRLLSSPSIWDAWGCATKPSWLLSGRGTIWWRGCLFPRLGIGSFIHDTKSNWKFHANMEVCSTFLRGAGRVRGWEKKGREYGRHYYHSYSTRMGCHRHNKSDSKRSSI